MITKLPPDAKTIIITIDRDIKGDFVVRIANKPELLGSFQRLLMKGAEQEGLIVSFEPMP